MLVLRLLRKFESNQVFTNREAWTLFRLAAFIEACGWTLLLIGISLEHLIGNHAPVTVAGRIHGVFFCIYALAAAGLYPNLKWSRPRACIALLATLPPYGSLLFERWAWHKRRSSEFRTYRNCILLAQVSRA